MITLHKKNGGGSIAIKSFPGAVGTFEVGQAVAVNSDGKIAQVSGTTKPSFICAAKETVTSVEPMEVACIPIYDDCEFKTVFSADASSLKAGAKVTIATTYDSVTATTTNGVATIVEKLGSGATGTEVIVKF